MSFYQFFTYKNTSIGLTSDNEFLTMSIGTQIVRTTGQQYEKAGTNIFNKITQTILSADEAEDAFGIKTEDNTWVSNNYFTQNVTIEGTNTVGDLIVTNTSEFNGTAVFNENVTMEENLTVDGTLTVGGTSSFQTVNAVNFNPYTNLTGSIGQSNLIWATGYINTIYGTINHALYSDLAEKYTTDQEYEYGTVLQVNTTGTSQLTKFKGGTLAGVIAQKPGFRMNSGSIEGQYVTLKGMIPVLAYSDIKKGQYCIAIDGKVKGVNKTKMTFDDYLNCVGVALADSADGYVTVKI